MKTTSCIICIIRTVCILIYGAVCTILPAGAAIEITSIGSWSRPITASDLLGAGGSALTSTYESASNQVVLSVTGTTGNSAGWRIDIHRTDSTWDNRLTFSLKRTGDGLGGGSILGGTSYQPLGVTSSTFFTGTGDRAGIPLQLKFSGVSVLIPANSYATEITFTVVEL